MRVRVKNLSEVCFVIAESGAKIVGRCLPPENRLEQLSKWWQG